MLDVCIIAYLDDLIIFSPDKASHTEHLCQVTIKLYEANLYIKLSKCGFYKFKVSFLGNIILEDGHAACPSKTEAILNWPPPTNRAELRGFLSTVNFLIKFCPGVSK